MHNPTDNHISLTVHNMHLYYDNTLYSFPLHTFLWPEDGPRWPKHVVSIINRIQDSCVLTYPTPSLTTSTSCSPNSFFPRQVHQIKFSVYFSSLRSWRPSPSHYCHQPLFLWIPRGSQTKVGVLFARHGMLSVHTHLLATSPRVLLLFSLFRRASIQPRQCQSLHSGKLSD